MKKTFHQFREETLKRKLGLKTQEQDEPQKTSRNSMEVGKMYYSLCPDDPKKYRSIRLQLNPWTQKLIPQISNPVEGVPPDELEEISPWVVQRLMRV